MSDKPWHNREDIQEDLVQQIISQELNKQDSPPKEEAPPSEKRNKRSSAYIYLMILFGAAFLMLLLAYFIQQRNNESTISDLRNSMNLSREELMDEIEALQAEKEQLNAAIQENEAALEEEKQQRITAEALAEEYFDEGLWHYRGHQSANALAWLERFCTEGDWLMAASVVEADDLYFNEKNRDYERNWEREPTPVQAAWYLALREKVFENAGCMVMASWSTSEDGSDYTERPYIDLSGSRYDMQAVKTAQNLWVIISSYSNFPADKVADLSERVENIYTDGGLELLNGGAFQPSTVELLEQITQDLIDQGLLKENEDGTVSPRTPLSITDVGIEDGQWIS